VANIHRFSQNIKAVVSFDNTLANSTQNGVFVDCLGFRRAAIIFNTWTGSATTSNFTVSESADGSTGVVTVAGATLGAAVVASTADAGTQIVDVDLSKRLRYLRVNSVGTGTAGNASATLLLYEADNGAVTQPVAALSV
jgi:hypothetical protein